MQFSIWCPDDGTVQVGLEDIDSIVVRSKSDVEVVFTCPKCSRSITLSAEIPQALLASLDDSWFRTEDGGDGQVLKYRIARADAPPVVETPVRVAPAAEASRSPEEESRIGSYCEFFRRELAGVETAEDLIAQMGPGES